MCSPSLDEIIFKVQLSCSNILSPVWEHNKIESTRVVLSGLVFLTKFVHWASIYPIVKWKSLLPGKVIGRRESVAF